MKHNIRFDKTNKQMVTNIILSKRSKIILLPGNILPLSLIYDFLNFDSIKSPKVLNTLIITALIDQIKIEV